MRYMCVWWTGGCGAVCLREAGPGMRGAGAGRGGQGLQRAGQATHTCCACWLGVRRTMAAAPTVNTANRRMM